MRTELSRTCAMIVGFVLVMNGGVPAAAIEESSVKRSSPATSGGQPSPATYPTASTTVPGTYSFNTSDSQFITGSDNQGWWSNQVRSNTPDNDNYLVGKSLENKRYRNFFTFDLSSLESRVYRATLKLKRYADEGGPTLTYVLSDVITGARKLNNNGGPIDPAIYKDLGTGTRYGTFHVSTRTDKQLRSLL